ncbi:uncharacterized protein [Clytia hemisphaerica]|uniref:Uncharacterized protein n=1 Tax=Clytia hemisphaerica TaxID=252671 RepID=A0A7M5WJD6_9CNID
MRVASKKTMTLLLLVVLFSVDALNITNSTNNSSSIFDDFSNATITLFTTIEEIASTETITNDNPTYVVVATPSASQTTISTSSVSSIHTTIQPTAPATTPANSSIVVIPTTSAETRCRRYTKWDPDVYLTSAIQLTSDDVQRNAKLFDIHLECNSRKVKDEPQNIAEKLTQYLLLRAERITSYTSTQAEFRGKIIEKVKGVHFSAEFGTVKRSFTLSHNKIEVEFSEDNIEDTFQFPPHLLEEDMVSYECSIFTEIYNPTDNFLYWKEATPIRRALEKLPPSISNPAPDEELGYQINSNILFFSVAPLKKNFEDYVLIKFKLRDPEGTTNHRCVKYNPSRISFWSDAGCYVHEKDEKFIYCLCDTIVGRYAIISDLTITPPAPPKLNRDSLTTTLYAISGFGIFAALASIILPYALKCQHLGGMLKVYRTADITFIIYCAVVLLSVMTSEDLGSAKIIAAALHFLHHASAIWFIVEGVHLYHEMTPLYSSSIGMIFFYSTLAFGMSAAMAGAATGYNYVFSGKTQFLWVYANGGDAFYMFIPTIGIVIMQVAFDVLLVWELMSWIGSKYDYLYTRSTIFIRRCTGYIFVYAFTHVFGVMAMSNQDSSTYAWLFVGLYGIQTICLFYHHFASNVECWTWKEIQNFKKELEMAGDGDSEMDTDTECESDDEQTKEEADKEEEPQDEKNNKETIIDMDDGSVFFEQPSDTISSQARLTRRKSEFSCSSESRLIRSDSSCSAHEGSQGDLRQSPRIEEEPSEEVADEPPPRPAAPEPIAEERPNAPVPEEEPERPPSRASIATTVSYNSDAETGENETQSPNVQDNSLE